jgi:hypothetical protein
LANASGDKGHAVGTFGLCSALGIWHQMIEDCLSPDALKKRGLIRPDAVAPMMKSLFEGSSAYQYRLWLLLWLELWYRNWVDDAPAAI